MHYCVFMAMLEIFIMLMTATFVCQQYKGNALFCFHGNNDYVNMPQYYFTQTLSILFVYIVIIVMITNMKIWQH
jgi:ABC-type uncharacterized transport system permease subunit